jgi:glycosyltransferase involved in cell wall biosynthesis
VEPADVTDLVILVPVYNDWEAAGLLLSDLAGKLPQTGSVRVVLVDDGSNEPLPAKWKATGWERFERVDVLSLRRNLGHQRALAIGLCHVEANIPCHAVVVMDGDGEDSPADVPRLLERMRAEGNAKIVFAERTKRSESLLFRLFYRLYRWLHWVLTGIPVRVGNFSAIPAMQLKRLVAVSDLWNHYAAAVFKARLPFVMLPTERAQRLAGRSRMNFVALVIHGLSAISVFGERVGVRLLIAVSFLLAATTGMLVATVAIRFCTNWAIPGWATNMVGYLLILLAQLFMLVTVFVFVILGGREGSSFLPLRDYVYFVSGGTRIHPSDES